jgi:PAS domain S-box-containing protein
MLQLNKSESRSVFLTVIGLILLVLFFYLGKQIDSNEIAHHLFFHTLLELISISVCVSIFIYGWLTLPYSQSKILLLVALTFLTVAIFEVLHVLTYPGMPFKEISHQASAWLWIMARSTESVALIIGLYMLNKGNYIKNHFKKFIWLLIYILAPIVISYFIIVVDENLTPLVTVNGTTTFKKILEYSIAVIHIVAILIIWKHYRRNKSVFLLNLIRACIFLILCGISVTLYESVQDPILLIGHLFKIVGYFFIMKAFYYANIQVPLENKRQTEEKLLDVESELELLFKNTDDAIFIYKLHSKQLIQRNPAFTRMFGYGEDEPLSVDCLVPKELKSEYEQLLQNLAEGQSIVDYKTKRQRADRHLLDVSMTVSPMRSQDGEILCASIIRNVTEQRKAEKELQETRRELQETLAQHQGIIFKFKKVDNQFIYTLIEGKILRESGVLPEEVIGLPVQSMALTNDTELFERYNERAWQGEAIEFQYEGAEGYIYLASLIPIKREGEIVEVLGTVVDITTLIKTEELLRRTEKLSVVGELAAGFAHEIRNPLTTIKGFLQLIKQETDEKKLEYMAIMLNEIDRLEMITNEFMVVAKPQVTNYQMEDLQVFTEKVIQFLQPQALLKDVEMVLKVNQSLPQVYCDRNQLRQVFINLYKNAMEAMPSGGQITTVLTVEDDHLLISITDQGIGIPENLIPRLGEPFYTLKEKGTGLGLMVSRKIIESHHGTLTIDSKINVGTTMTIRLPINTE